MNHNPLIIGGTHHNTLSIIRCIGTKGLKVDLILHDEHGKDSYVIPSRYIRKHYVAKDEEEAIVILKKVQEKSGPLIICSDGIAALLNGRTTHYMNKQVQGEVAKGVGMNVPKCKVCIVGDNKIEAPLYPCIVKPLESIHGGKRFCICKNEKDLSNAIATYREGNVIQIQQYIKRDKEIVIDGVALPDGNIIIPGYVYKHRDYLGGTTFSTTYPVSALPEEIVCKIKQLVKNIGYEGLFGVELIINKGEYYFVEINLRNDATTYALAVAGVNLPYIYALAKQGFDYQKEANKPIRTINSIVEFRDLPFVLKGKLSPWQWWRDYKSCECKYFYDKEDIEPYKKAKRQFICGLLSKMTKKLR